MSLSTLQLHDDFKSHFKNWEGVLARKKNSENLLLEIQTWGIHIEKLIQEKIRLLEMDFNDCSLRGEYFRSVMEGFDDLDEIMRTNKTFLDIAKGHDFEKILHRLKQYYKCYLIPLFNIIAKLENDFVSISIKNIAEKKRLLLKIDFQLKSLKEEKEYIKKRLFYFTARNRKVDIARKIEKLEMQSRLVRLTLHHDKLNLYYFNSDRPKELREIKERASKLRGKLEQLEEMENVNV